ncbi:MAG TPA: hypothetical protein VGF39_05870 [Stellaceae bacterium]|jgi:hypothetical protein
MPIGVTLADLRYELRAEIYASLLPAHGLSSVDMQNALLERAQRELWNQYAWPHLHYRIDFTTPPGTQYLTYDPTMPFENVLSLWYNYQPNAMQPWKKLRYGFEDWINETLQSYPPVRWRHVAIVNPTTGLTDYAGQAQVWPIPSLQANLRWLGQSPLNPLKVDADQCLIDSTAIVLTVAAELLGAQKSETGALKGNKAQAYIRRLLGKSGANKRDITAMGQGAKGQPTYMSGATPYIDYIPGP